MHNSGRKPETYTKSKHPNTEPDVLVNYLISENLETSSNVELMITLMPASSSGQWKAATNIQEKFRFQDPREKRPKLFELCLCQKLLPEISKCQGNCGRKMGL